MRKHGTITACAGVGRIRPQARDRRAQGRTAVLSARHRLFRKANAHRREPQVPQEQPGHREFRGCWESQDCRESQALIIRGGHARNRVVFINSRRGHGKKGVLPESCGLTDLALCLRQFVAAKCEWREAPGEGPQGPRVDENLSISGRCPPVFLQQKFTGVALARASMRKRAEQRRADERDAHQTTTRSRSGNRVAPARKPQRTPGYATQSKKVLKKRGV